MKKKYTAVSITFQENFTPRAIALTNEDHTVKNKMETTYLIQALAEYTHKNGPAKSPVNLNDHN